MLVHFEVKVFPDQASLYHGAAALVTDALASAQKDRGMASVVLSGGSTPRPLYELLATSPARQSVDWSRVQFFWSDERCVDPHDPQSNYRMALETFLSKVYVPSDHIHRIRGEMEDRDQAALDYESEIRALQPGIDPVRFDLVLLGMGEEGHTASLFPGVQWDEKRLAMPTYVPKLEAWRITMTPRVLNAARFVVFLVAGAEKAKAVTEVLEHPAGDLPASQIRPKNGRLVWLLDPAAASVLESKPTR